MSASVAEPVEPTIVVAGAGVVTAAARGRALQLQDDATKADQRKAASQQVELGGYQVGEAKTKSEALAEVSRRKAAGTFNPQKNPEDRDLAIMAGQPNLGAATYQQTLDAEAAADKRRYGYQISAQDHQFNNQVRLADRDLPRGMTAQQKSTMDYLFSELKDQSDKANAEMTRLNAIITENETTIKNQQPSYFAQSAVQQGVPGIELDPKRAEAANARFRARSVQLANNLRLAAAGMMRTLETQGMTHEDAKAVANQRLQLILSRLPNAQRPDGAGGYQDVNPNLPLESELLQAPPSPVRPPPVNPNAPPSGAGYNPGGGGVRLRIKGQQ